MPLLKCIKLFFPTIFIEIFPLAARRKNSKLWNSRIRAGSNLHVFSSNPLIFLLGTLECDVNRIYQVHMLQTCSLKTQNSFCCSYVSFQLLVSPFLFLAKLHATAVHICSLCFLNLSAHLPRPQSCHFVEIALTPVLSQNALCKFV